MYSYEIDPSLDKALRKVAKKSKITCEAVQKQIIKISKNPNLGKPLKFPLAGLWRVHVGPFVLT